MEEKKFRVSLRHANMKRWAGTRRDRRRKNKRKFFQKVKKFPLAKYDERHDGHGAQHLEDSHDLDSAVVETRAWFRGEWEAVRRDNQFERLWGKENKK